jgi:hypothetical protein
MFVGEEEDYIHGYLAWFCEAGYSDDGGCVAMDRHKRTEAVNGRKYGGSMSRLHEEFYPTYLDESLLLLDEALIETENGIEREVQQAEKVPFVLDADKDKLWEYSGPGMSRRVHLYGTVLYDDLIGKYRMWYFCRMGPHWRVPNGNFQVPGLYMPRTDEKPYHCNGVTEDHYGRPFVDNDRGDLTCYAESDDGIKWVKLRIGDFSFNGNYDNNIFWDLHGASVFIDREETDPTKRYKAIGFCRRYRNIFLITSPDGLHWNDKDHLDPVSERGNEGSFNVTFDARAQLFRAYSIVRFGDREKRRVICYTESPSLEGPWKDSRPMLEPSNWDDEMAHRKFGALRAEFHNMSALRYNNVHLGLLGVLNVTAEQIPKEANQVPCDGPVESQFVYSGDGINWAHACRERTAAIPCGARGAWDQGMVMGVAREPIIEGDDVHWYYTGCEHTHGETDMEKRTKRIGRATWKRDRFVALGAEGEGEILTKAISLPDEATGLEVNTDARDGQVRVEVCDAEGEVLDGFTKEACGPLTGDVMHGPVGWDGKGIGDVRGPVKLRFCLDRANVYSFTLV